MIRKSGYRFSLATNAQRLREDHAQKKIERDDDSKKSHHALTLQQRRNLGVDESAVDGIVDRISGAMAVDRRNGVKFSRLGVDQPAELVRVVARVEVAVRLPRHQQDPC